MPCRLELTGSLKDGKSTLELEVTNLCSERIIGDEQPGNAHTYAKNTSGNGLEPLLPEPQFREAMPLYAWNRQNAGLRGAATSNGEAARVAPPLRSAAQVQRKSSFLCRH